MIRPDFPYLPPHRAPVAGSVGCVILGAVGRILSGHGSADAETGDASEGRAWFARFDCGRAETLRTMLESARESDPDDISAALATRPEILGMPDYFDDAAGFIYGRDSDGFEIVGAWRDADRFARAWHTLTGEWADPEMGFAVRASESRSRHAVRFGHGIRVETAEGFRGCGICFRLVGDSGASLLIQTDTDFPGVAALFGWRPQGPLNCRCFDETDGSVGCRSCGKSAADFISEAVAHIEAVADTGIRGEDPGYFDTPDGSARG